MDERRIMAVRDGRNPYGSRGGYVSSRRPRRGRGRRGDRGMDYASGYGDMRGGMDYGDMARGGRGGQGGNRGGRGGDRGDMGYDMRGGDYGYDMRGGMDGHYPMQHGGYQPIEAMGYFNGYYGMPEQDYGRGGGRGYDMRGGRDYGDYGDYGDDYGDYGETLSEKELEEWAKKLKSKLEEREKQMFSKEAIMQKAKQMGRQMEGFGEKELEVTALMLYDDYKKTIGANPDVYIKLAFDWLDDKDAAVKGAEKLAIYHDCIVEGGEE